MWRWRMSRHTPAAPITSMWEPGAIWFRSLRLPVGPLSMAARLAEELRHIWPQPADASHVGWIAEPEREIALSSDQGL
jgi:hypothetical protein